MGKKTDLAIIDVSRYSSSIDWEVRFLTEVKPARSLVIASDDSPTLPLPCEFAGTVVRYSVSPASDLAFEERARARLEAMLQ